MTQTKIEKILEEFEKKVGGGLSANPDFKKEVKEFVVEVYEQARQEAIEEIPQMEGTLEALDKLTIEKTL